MSGHTPGPWGVWHEDVFAGPFEVVEGGIKGFRAQICSMDDLDLDEEEVEANARLIAAAPDSIAACVAMVDALNVAFGITSDRDDEYIYDSLPTSAVAGAYFAARAAIAKATGGAE